MYYDITTLNKTDSISKSFIAIHDIHGDLSDLHQFFDALMIQDMLSNISIRYEDHLKYEAICVLNNLCIENNVSNHDEAIYVFVQQDSIHFVGNIEYLTNFMNTLKEVMANRKKGIGLILHQFLLMIVNDYHQVNDQIESEISQLEDEILAAVSDDHQYSKRILHYRKSLLLRKRRYEQMLDVIDYLLDNNNEIYDELTLSHFNILKDRVNRMLSQILSNLEYVTEVREAYQSAVDTRQNKIMSLFTVITSIFLPLSLIAGWYGMNLKMPEFSFDYAYPIVTIISILIVVFCVYYFKKKKWF